MQKYLKAQPPPICMLNFKISYGIPYQVYIMIIIRHILLLYINELSIDYNLLTSFSSLNGRLFTVSTCTSFQGG
jgi:hypothetical protein